MTGADHPVGLLGDALHLGPVTVRFMRTLRVPDSGVSALPPGLGTFPLRRVADYPDTVPPEWSAHGGVMLPVYQREAMWLSFASAEPAALQVAVGRVCAVSGETWSDALVRDPQNYLPLPQQPWLDGVNTGDGEVRQFVAVRLGAGATVEGQVTGEEVHGGVQLRAVGLTTDALATWQAEQRRQHDALLDGAPGTPYPMAAAMPEAMPPPAPVAAMGLGAGGRLHQEVYTDHRAAHDYDEQRSWRVFVHLVSASHWPLITGELPPPTPVDRDAYTAAGFPWFDYYDAEQDDLPAPGTLRRVRPVSEVLGITQGAFVSVEPGQTVRLRDPRVRDVPDGDW